MNAAGSPFQVAAPTDAGAQTSPTVTIDEAAFIVNGERFALPTPPTVAALLASRGLVGKRLAVERNGAIVPRSAHATTALAAGDRVEIVVAVGGG